MSKKRLTKAERKKTVRYVAMTILTEVEQEKAYVNLQLSHALDKQSFSKEDANLLTELVYGVTQRKLTLDAVLKPYIHKKIPVWLQSVLRLSVFQLLFLDRVPDFAVLNEASEITRIKAGQSIVNFVNGVLRNVTRHGKEQLNAIYQLDNTVESVALKTSMPVWLVAYLSEQLGLEQVYQLGMSLLEKPYLSLRALNREQLMTCLQDRGYSVEKSPLAKQGIRLLQGQITQTDFFQQGAVTIQDDSSMLVAPIGQIKEHDYVLDACAAPGGKTTHMAQFLDAKKGGKIIALDVHEHKLALIEQNAKRLQVSDCIETKLLDARNVHETFDQELFDVVFVDAPCSGLGLMRRKPDIKYTKQKEEIFSLSLTQQAILKSVAPSVKVNGRLVYSTCTLTQEENEQVIEQFLATHQQFERESLAFMQLPQDVYNDKGAVCILPHQYHTDGFYICSLKKIKE